MSAPPQPMYRALRIGGVASNGVLRCRIKSFSDRHDYEIGVRLYDGKVHCTCPHFEHRCAHHRPTLWSTKLCKHLETYRSALIRERLLRRPPLPEKGREGSIGDTPREPPASPRPPARC